MKTVTVLGIHYQVEEGLGTVAALDKDHTVNVYSHRTGKYMVTFKGVEDYLKENNIPYKKWGRNY